MLADIRLKQEQLRQLETIDYEAGVSSRKCVGETRRAIRVRP
jgi:hypothetical protein